MGFLNKNKIPERSPVLLKKITPHKLSKNITYDDLFLKNYTVAFASTHKGVGCTHLALNTAYELSLKNSTALVELDPSSELSGFDECYELPTGRLKSKKLDNLEIYYFGTSQLVDIIQQQYEFIILDIGEILNFKYNTDDKKLNYTRSDYYSEAYRASKRIIVTQVREWQEKYLAEFIKTDSLEGWTVAANLTPKEKYQELTEALRSGDIKNISVVNIPYIENVFKPCGLCEIFLKG